MEVIQHKPTKSVTVNVSYVQIATVLQKTNNTTHVKPNAPKNKNYLELCCHFHLNFRIVRLSIEIVVYTDIHLGIVTDSHYFTKVFCSQY